MIQGCIDYKDNICPMANECLRRTSAECAPEGVTLIVAPYKETTTETIDGAICKQFTCDYFIEKRDYDQYRNF